MIPLLRPFTSQWVVLSRPRMLLGVLAAMIGAAVVATSISVSTAGTDAAVAGPPGSATSTLADLASVSGLVTGVGTASGLIGAIALAVAASVVAAEFSNGTIRTLLIREPRRTRLMAGRWLAIAGLVAMTAAAAVLASILVAFVTAEARGIDTSAWTSPDGLRAGRDALITAPASAVGYAALGVALGALLRSPSLSVGVGLAWVLPLENIIVTSWEALGDLLPGRLLNALAQGGTDDITLTAAAAGATAWSLGLAAVACAAFSRRDVTS